MGLINRLSNAYKALVNDIPYERSSGTDFPFGQNFHIWDRLWSSRKGIDFVGELGNLRESPIVMAGVQWVGRNLNSARPQVITLDGDQKEVEVANHPLPQLLKRPNPYYAMGSLWHGVALDWLVHATAYIRKRRNPFGQTVELWWEPFHKIRPAWPDDGSELISHYEIERNGYWHRVEKEAVIVLCQLFDPTTRQGISPTSALLRDYYTDIRAANFTALLVRNGLVPPVVVGLGDKDTPFKGDLEDFKSGLVRKMSGDNAGEPLVVEGPVDVGKLGFDYSSVGMRDLRQVPQMAFCSAMGISPTSLYFDTSRKESTYSNVEQFLKHDYRSYIVPLHDYIAEELTANLLPEFDMNDSRKVTWDYSQVAIMQADETQLRKDATELFAKDILKRSEAREMIGYKWDEEDEVYYSEIKPQKTSATMQLGDEGEVVAEENESPQRLRAVKRAISEDLPEIGVEWWEQNASPAARDLINAQTIKPTNGHGPS